MEWFDALGPYMQAAILVACSLIAYIMNRLHGCMHRIEDRLNKHVERLSKDSKDHGQAIANIQGKLGQ